jgi:lipid-A-disaccharide synthase
MDQEVVTELIQKDLTSENIIKELNKINNPEVDGRQKMLQKYSELKEKLGRGGASNKVANLLIESLKPHA